DMTLASWFHGPGVAVVAALAAVEVVIGLGGLVPGWSRRLAAAAGFVLSLLFWVLGQSLGQIYSGQATDPNAGLLFMLLAAVVMGGSLGSRRGAPASELHAGADDSSAPGRAA
ncbi:MAG: hypothetical protein ACRDYD_13420, partial [Acidimicrobiales bacterium]